MHAKGEQKMKRITTIKAKIGKYFYFPIRGYLPRVAKRTIDNLLVVKDIEITDEETLEELD